jgi:hypothetical protein
MFWRRRRKKDPFADYPFRFVVHDRIRKRGGRAPGTVMNTWMDERRGVEMVALLWDGSGYFRVRVPAMDLVRWDLQRADRVRRRSGGTSGTVVGVWISERDIEWAEVHWDGEGQPNVEHVEAASLERVEPG